MFANALDLDADTSQQPERMRMDDPVIERPAPSQVSCVDQKLNPRSNQFVCSDCKGLKGRHLVLTKSLALMWLIVACVFQAQSSGFGGRAESLHSNFGQHIIPSPGMGDLSSPMPNASTWGGFQDASLNAGTQSVLSAYDSPGLPGLTVPPLNQVAFHSCTQSKKFLLCLLDRAFPGQDHDQHVACAGAFSI